MIAHVGPCQSSLSDWYMPNYYTRCLLGPAYFDSLDRLGGCFLDEVEWTWRKLWLGNMALAVTQSERFDSVWGKKNVTMGRMVAAVEGIIR